MDKDTGYKFDSPSYMTRGIQSDIPFEIQLFMWGCIDSLKGKIPLDYLQVFVLEAVKKVISKNVDSSFKTFNA